MLTSYVLRVVEPAQGTQLAGTLELVADGTTVVFRSVDELLAALVPRQDADGPPEAVVRLDPSAGG